jgi:hypothetical protein
MGTNYYLHRHVCDKCGRSDEPIHIGKRSGGWTFSFRGYRNAWEADQLGRTLTREQDWRDFLESETAKGSGIQNEYGEAISLDYFWSMVNDYRSNQNNHTTWCLANGYRDHAERNCWLDDKGNSFSDADFS